jgi:hypothetical protein
VQDELLHKYLNCDSCINERAFFKVNSYSINGLSKEQVIKWKVSFFLVEIPFKYDRDSGEVTISSFDYEFCG